MIKGIKYRKETISAHRFLRRFREMGPHICLIAPPLTRTTRSLPLGLLSLGGALMERGVSVSLLDFNLAYQRDEELIEERFFDYARDEIIRSGAVLFGITSLCSNYPLALRLASLIKESIPDSMVVLGGPQASLVYEETLLKFPAVDMVVVGEGEETLCELIERLYQGDDTPLIPGLAFSKGGKVFFQGHRSLIEDLDTLPLPDYTLINLKDYLKAELSDYMELEAGRGCPLQCTFCSTSLMWKRRFRAKSPERLLQEMSHLNKRYGITHFGLVHDNLTINRRYLKQLCSYFIEQGSPYRWTSSASLNTIGTETLEQMYEAGCMGIFIGIESGSPHIQECVRKRLRLEKAEKIVSYAHGLGIRVDASFIIGFPEETPEDLDMTLRMALTLRKAGAERVFLNLFAPLTGTSIYLQYLDKLKLMENGSSLATLPFMFRDVLSMILENPTLFSSFYVPPRPALKGLNLTDLNTFMDEMIDWFTVAYEELLETGYSPVEIFGRWFEWFGKRTGKVDRVKSGEVFETFPEFLRDCREEIFREATVPMTGDKGVVYGRGKIFHIIEPFSL